MDIQSSFNKLFPNITERLPAGPAKRPIVRKLVQKYQSEN